MSTKAAPAKAKIDLYPTEPIKFWAPVEIPTAKGDLLIISMRFLHRTREEQAKLAEQRIDRARARFEESRKAAAEKAARDAEAVEAAKASGVDVPAQFPETPKFVEQVQAEMEESVEGVLEIADEWNVDGFEFGAKNLQQLFNLHGAAAGKITTTYRDALAQGRLGN